MHDGLGNDSTMPPETTSTRRTTFVPNGKANSPRSSGKCASYPPPNDHGMYSTPFVGITYETVSFVMTLSSRQPCEIPSAVTLGRARSPSAPPLLIFSPASMMQTERSVRTARRVKCDASRHSAAIRAAASRMGCVLRTSTANNATAAHTQRRINACWNHP